MTLKQRINIICAVICFLFAAIYFYFTVNLHQAALIGEVSTKFVPKLLAALMAFLSALLFFVTLIEKPVQDKPESTEEAEQPDQPAFYGTVLTSFVALFLWSLVGFLSLPFLIGGTMFANWSRDTVKIIAISLGTTLVLYLMFFQLFEMQLPLGLLEAFVE